MDGLRAFVSPALVLVAAANLWAADAVMVVAHRGAMRFAPENTLASIRKAVAMGADFVEMDVRQTLDGHLVLMHDARLERTTTGAGVLARTSLADLRRLDAGGERVPTLEEAVAALHGKALPAIDFKAGDPARLVAILKKFDLLGKATLHCDDDDLLRRTLQLSPAFQSPPVNIDWPQFSRELVRQVLASGRQAFVNTMGPHDTEAGLLEAIESGATYIQTDRLDLLLPLLRARGLHR